jgi:hypothetical protein
MISNLFWEKMQWMPAYKGPLAKVDGFAGGWKAIFGF